MEEAPEAEEDPKAVPEGSAAHKSTEEDPKMVPGSDRSQEGEGGRRPRALL